MSEGLGFCPRSRFGLVMTATHLCNLLDGCHRLPTQPAREGILDSIRSRRRITAQPRPQPNAATVRKKRNSGQPFFTSFETAEGSTNLLLSVCVAPRTSLDFFHMRKGFFTPRVTRPTAVRLGGRICIP